MQLPTIHSNGTSKQALIDALCAASAALREAYDKLNETAPNHRDYYPQGDAAFSQAVHEHNGRMKRLDMVKGEVDALTWKIDRIGE